MTAEDLKKSILQQAIQGKLVPQSADDEPASKLLDRIRAEKARLVAEGKIKRDKNESVIFRNADGQYIERIGKTEKDISDEIPFEIPESWEICRLSSIIWQITDGTHSTPRYTSSGVPFLSVKDMSSGKLNFENTKYISIEEHTAITARCKPQKGDLLLSKVGSTGIPLIIDTDREFSIFVSLALIKFFPQFINSQYLLSLILSPFVQSQVQRDTRGVGNKNWVLKSIANTLMILPPLTEQERIVAKIEELMPMVEEYGKAQSRLDELNSSLGENLNKSVLQYAIQGKLVPQNPDDEPASEFLNRIRAEKARLIAESKIKRDKNESVIFRNADGQYIERIGKTETNITDQIPFDIPDSWVWVRVKNVGICETGTTPSKEHPEYFGDYIPFLGPSNIQNNQIISVTQGLSFEGSKYGRIVPKDTVLQVCIGGSIGKCAIVDRDVTFNQQINSVTPIFVNVKYLFVCLQSDNFTQQIKLKSTGTATPIINRGNWELLLIPIPPLAEQKRIVERIEQIISIIEN